VKPSIEETRDIAACLSVRRAVFTVEQGIAEADDVDGRDSEAIHLLARMGDRPVGTLRILVSGDTGKIGRLSVLPECRGQGIGGALLDRAVKRLASKHGVTRAYLSAQSYAIPFYEARGFRPYGEDYDDVGIPHRDMERML
jgi:predicted GNAT family N-acyltransferase